MLVSDLVCNNDFDVNCNYAIYDCTEIGKSWDGGAHILFSTKGSEKPKDDILNMKIKHITMDGNFIIIEAVRPRKTMKAKCIENRMHNTNFTIDEEYEMSENGIRTDWGNMWCHFENWNKPKGFNIGIVFEFGHCKFEIIE